MLTSKHPVHNYPLLTSEHRVTIGSMSAESTHASIARRGALATNASMSIEQRRARARKGARILWKGHKKNNPECLCIMCKIRRAAKNKKQ